MKLSDTQPEMEEFYLQLLRQASPAQKLEMLAQLNSSARLLALAGLCRRFPHAGEVELHRRLASLLLGEELALKV